MASISDERRWQQASNLIEKETNERRTSNVQHRTLPRWTSIELMYSACRELLGRTINFKKRVSEAIPAFDIRHSIFFGSAVRFSIW